MTLADLTARAEYAIRRLHDAPGCAPSAERAESILRDLLAHASTVSQERDTFRAVLEGAEYQHLDRLLTLPNGLDDAMTLGQHAAALTKQLQADLVVARTRAAQAEQADAVIRKFLKTLEQRGSISGWWGSVVLAAEAYEEQYPVAATHPQETPK